MAKWQKVSIPLSKKYSPLERQAIAQDVIDFIIKRTRDGKDVKGKDFPGKYSNAYTSSADYKIAGKPKSGKPINLSLTREMLNELSFLSDKKGEIIVGYDKGDTELNGKVEGNRLGTYGQSKPIPGKARDFLGITQKDLQTILKNYPLSDRQKSKENAETNLLAKAEAEELAQGIDIEEFEIDS